MKTFSIIKLPTLSPIHIGMGREVTDNSAHTLHSDTLSAALAAIRVQTKGDKRVYKFIFYQFSFPFLGRSAFFTETTRTTACQS